MIDFKEEISKFKPILEIDDVENSLKNDELQDIMDLLGKLTENKKGKE